MHRTLLRTASILAVLLLCTWLTMPDASAQRTASPRQADDTLIVLLAPGANMDEVKQLLTEVNGTIVRVTTVSRGGYSILRVKPAAGKQSDTEKKLLAKHDKNIKAIERNYLGHFEKCSGVPNDPDYSSQWNLADIHFAHARKHAIPSQSAITLIDTGVGPININNEMVNIAQFNFVNGANGVCETPFDTGQHGTAVTGVAAAETNNNTLIAGVASGANPVQVTMCRVSADGETAANSDVIDALAWCINNQSSRGGPGPVNVAINEDPPNTYNSSAVMQQLGQSLQSQGDLYVNGSGNAGTVDNSAEQYIRRVAATDQDDDLASFSVTGPFQAAAPGVSILTFEGSDGTLGFISGTSFACAHWSGVISYLIGIGSGLTAPQADRIIFNQATVTSAGWHIPDMKHAVKKVLKIEDGDDDDDCN